MKNFDLSAMGVHEMSAQEMQETDGGFIWLLVAAVVILLTAESCNNNSMVIQVGSVNSCTQKGGGTMTADSTLNGNSLQVPILP